VARLVLKIVAAVVAAAATVLLGLDSRGVIALSRSAGTTTVLVAAALAAAATIAVAWGEWRRRRDGSRSADLDVLLSATAWAIVDLVAIDYRDLGLAAYRVGRTPWAPWRERLVRVHRVRARRRPAASRVRWAPGKGVIGTCVSRGQVVAADLRSAYAALGPVTQAEWEALPADVRLGLTWAELGDVRDKYEVVVATPVIDDSGSRARIVGCVALDGPAGTIDDLGGDDVLGLLDSAGQTLLRQGW